MEAGTSMVGLGTEEKSRGMGKSVYEIRCDRLSLC